MSEVEQEFTEYLSRVHRHLGEIQTGQYGHFRNRLVRKLNRDQFADKLAEYGECGQALITAVENGDTIDERLTVQIRAIEFDLVMEKSRYLP